MRTSFLHSRLLSKKCDRYFIVLAVLLLLLCVAGGGSWSMLYARNENSNEAYGQGNQVTLTPQIAGTVTQVSVKEGDYVEKGQRLATVYPSNTELALQQAESTLESTVSQVQGLYSTADHYCAQVAIKAMALRAAQQNYTCEQKVFVTGAITAKDLSHYRDAVASAQSGLHAAQEALQTYLAMIDDTVISSHPEIKRAEATLHELLLAHSHTTIIAPVSGYVAKHVAQPGMQVVPSTPILTIVPLDKTWVG